MGTTLRPKTRVFSQRCGVSWMVGWVGSVPNCWARGGGFETWIDRQRGSKKTARLQNTRPTKYLTKKNGSRSPPVVRFAKEILTSTVGVRECGSTSIPCSISILVTWNRLREYGTVGAPVSDCAQECLTAGAPSSIPRSISTLITWNRLRENGTAVALVVYPLNIFFLATLGLLDCRRSTCFTHLDLSIRHNRKWLREEFYK